MDTGVKGLDIRWLRQKVKEVNAMWDCWCDGSVAPPNPGPGAHAALVISPNGRRFEILGGSKHTTNNREEYKAAIVALRFVQSRGGQRVRVYSDSGLLVFTMTEWFDRWIKSGTLRSKKNVDLIEELIGFRSHFQAIYWKLVKGHAGIPLNEHVDKLAGSGTRRVKKHGVGFVAEVKELVVATANL